MLFNVETAEDFSIWASFLYKDVVADTLVERAYINSLFGLGILELVNPNAKHSLEERLGDFLMPKHHSKHEPVRYGELFKRSAFCIHFFILQPKRVGFREQGVFPSLYYTRNFQTLTAISSKNLFLFTK